MKKIRLMMFISVITCLFTACGTKKDKDIDDVNIGIDEQTFDQLVKESKNKDLKNKVLEYINGDKRYVEMGKVEKDGVIYKSVQMNLNEEWDSIYKNLTDYLLETEGIKEELEKELNNTLAETPAKSTVLKRNMSARVMTGLYEDMGKEISFERGEDFNLFKEWIVTALLKYDESGRVVDVIVFDGAIGGSLNIKDDKVAWEVCIADKVNYFYWGVDPVYGPEIDGTGRMSGTVYSMIINENYDIDKIIFIRETKNNDFDSICCDIGHTRPEVKNYDLKISDFINSEELKKLITTNPSDFKNQIRSMYGMEHEQGVYVRKSVFEQLYKQDAMYYFTTDGYLVSISTVPRWVKITMEEAYETDVEEWEEMVSELMFVGELNPEFGEMNIENNKEGDITNVDTLVDKSEERELKEYLETIGYSTYDISIQYAMEYSDKKYFAVQMDLWRGIDEGDINRSFLWDGVTYLEEFEEVTFNLDEKDKMSKSEYDDYNNYLSMHPFIRQKDDIGHLITYGDGMSIEDGWMVTKLIIVDKSGKLLDEKTLKGTITTGLGVRDGCVEWEVFSSNKVDYYAVKCGDEKDLSGHGYSSGNIYRIILDERNLVSKKELIRESFDNDYDSLCIKEDINYQNSDNRNVFVKNNELTIKDFIENEDVVKSASGWNLNYYGKTLLGASHVFRDVYDGPQIYFTKDRYVVYVDTYVKYMKMSKDEFLEKYGTGENYSWKDEFKSYLYEPKVNPKLLKD